MADVPVELREPFLDLGSIRRFSRGDVIIIEEANTSEVYILLSGFVRIIKYTASGEQSVLAIRTRGDLVGELAALDGEPRSSTVVAASPATAVRIDALLFRAFTGEHRSVGEAVARSVVGKLRAATRYRGDLGPASVLTRVARVLEHLADGYGRPAKDRLLIDAPLPQRDLASLVGMSEKSVYRAYEQLRRAGAIDVAYRRVTIRNPVLLHRYADGDAPGRSDEN